MCIKIHAFIAVVNSKNIIACHSKVPKTNPVMSIEVLQLFIMTLCCCHGFMLVCAEFDLFNWAKIFTGPHYQNVYSDIDKYLISHVDDENTAKNMAKAAEWYEELKKSEKPSNAGLLGALEQLLSLDSIDPINRCSAQAHSILLRNDQATHGKAHKQRTQLGHLRRIDRIVHDYLMRHAIDCMEDYPVIWRSRREEMDRKQVRLVENFMCDILENFTRVNGDFKKEANKRYARYVLAKSLKSIRSKKTAELAVETLEELTRSDPDRKYLYLVLTKAGNDIEFRKDKVEGLFLKYLVQPCVYYVRELGPDVFVPASYDVSMLEEEDRFRKGDPEVLNFLLSWTRYHLCELLLTKDLKHIAGDVAREAYNRL